MKIIGITGTSGSGKGYLSDIIRGYGFTVIDADKVTHTLYEGGECVLRISELFGDVTDDKGAIDRKKLGGIVFNDREKLLLLQDTVYGYITSEIFSVIENEKKKGASAVFVDAPQLFEAGIDKDCDFIISVIADESVRLSRITKRDGISKESARMRMKNQKSSDFFIENSDFVIENNGGEIGEKVREVLAELKLI
ncbi:MAG: dephospho-CoA kinase [Clostridia bacterium]|nr:dephospho-CoA kinase [Clostridia bacterium]